MNRQFDKVDMNRFILFTGGRTGSTAVIDELKNCKDFIINQELFLVYDFQESPVYHYDHILPYTLWKNERISRNVFPDFISANWYLDEAEIKSKKKGAETFGFKLLSHQFTQWPFLRVILLRRKYKVIYLKRNIARQVISGMIARMRGLYNTRASISDSSEYKIDLGFFAKSVKEKEAAQFNDYVMLSRYGFEFIIVSYEEFCNERELFFYKIFSFLNVNNELPAKSTFSISIKDLEKTVKNHREVTNLSRELGWPLE